MIKETVDREIWRGVTNVSLDVDVDSNQCDDLEFREKTCVEKGF